MARTYRLGMARQTANRLMRGLIWLGLAPRGHYLLTTRGRRTGRLHSTPITLVEEGTERWLVAPYGAVGWVRNARAAGRVTLSRGGRSETVGIIELDARTAAPVLKRYATEVPITRPFFDATPDSPLDGFAAEAHRHPVFRLVSSET